MNKALGYALFGLCAAAALVLSVMSEHTFPLVLVLMFCAGVFIGRTID